jgi:hypothetical protein
LFSSNVQIQNDFGITHGTLRGQFHVELKFAVGFHFALEFVGLRRTIANRHHGQSVGIKDLCDRHGHGVHRLRDNGDRREGLYAVQI